MNFDRDKLKEFLYKELRNTFNDNDISSYDISFRDALDLFFEVLDEKIDDRDLAGTSKIIITSIDNYAYNFCTSLTSITIPRRFKK